MTLWAEGLQIAADVGNEYEAPLQDAPPAAHDHSSQS
jgi:hypothetical protein